jgi:hypothetical protein
MRAVKRKFSANEWSYASVLIVRSAKRSPDQNLDWNALTYDLKDVKWDELNWKSILNTPAAAEATPAAEQKKPEPVVTPTPTPEAKKQDTYAAKPATTSTEAAETKTSAAAPSKTEDSKDSIGDVVADAFAGVARIASKLGAQIGKNDKHDNGGIWISGDGEWGMDVTNNGKTDAVYYCWKADGFSGMSINKFVPDVSVGMKAGQTVQLSFKAGVPAACAPASLDTTLALFGGLHQTWAEVTFGNNGAFDVSRNVNMKGCNISMQGSKCLSDMNTCVFKCQDESLESCEKGYKLLNCDAGNGGGGGYDPIMQGVGGGCAMDNQGERIKVSFS